MTTKSRVAALIGAVVLVGAGAAGCGSGGGTHPPPAREQVATTVRSFLSAAAAGDGTRACALLDAGVRRKVVVLAQRAAGLRGSTCPEVVSLLRVAVPPPLLRALRTARVQDVAVRGGRATAVVAAGPRLPRERIVLRRSDSTWRITAAPALLGG